MQADHVARSLLALPLVLGACSSSDPEPPAGPAEQRPEPAAQATGDAPAAGAQAVDPGPSLAAAAAWLAARQDGEGMWHDDREGVNDVGVSALALLALMHASPDGVGGEHAGTVRAGARALIGWQDPQTGLIGDKVGHAFLYGHGIATLLLCELYAKSGDPELERPARLAVNQVLRARNPYAAWRYSVPPTGENDTSVTGWMMQALLAAREAGLETDDQAFQGGLAWIDEVTDPATGRVGYDSLGSLSSRIPRVNDHLPAEMGEAMTAIGLHARTDLGADPEGAPILVKHAELIRRKLPEPWDGGAADLYYWYQGTCAMKAMGGAWWDAWRRALTSTLVEMQVAAGDDAGSWDPVDPWSALGGRVYTTALATLALAECR